MNATEIERRTEQLRSEVLPILYALLSSGHYTERIKMEDVFEERPLVTVRDNGRKWKERGYDFRFESVVITDAIALADELRLRLKSKAKRT